MSNVILNIGLVALCALLTFISLIIYSELGLLYAVLFGLFEIVKASIAGILYVKLITRD